MSERRLFGPGVGGLGRATVDLKLSGLFETEATLRSFVLENGNAILEVESLVLAAAFTAVTKPVGSSAVLIVPAATNVYSVTLKGVTGDTGVALSPTIPTLLPFDETTPSTPPETIGFAWPGSVYADEALTSVTAATNLLELTGHTLADGDRVRFGGTTVPDGLSADYWYYVRDDAANTFKVALTDGGTEIDILTAGTAVTITSSQHFTLYWL